MKKFDSEVMTSDDIFFKNSLKCTNFEVLCLGLGVFDEVSVSVSKFEPGLGLEGYGIDTSLALSGVRRKFSWGGFQSSKIFLCTKIESMIRKNIKQAAIQYVNIVKQL